MDPQCDTIRHVDCEVIIPISISKKHIRHGKDGPEKSKHYSRLRARHDTKSKTIERLKLKVSALVKKGGVKNHLTLLK